MLIKSYEILKKDLNFLNSFLFYGENTGLKQDIVKSVIGLKEKKNIKYKQFKFEEGEIIKNWMVKTKHYAQRYQRPPNLMKRTDG